MLIDTAFAASQMQRDSVRLVPLAILGGLSLALIVFALCAPFAAANRLAVVLLLGSIAFLGAQLVITLASSDEQPAFFMYLTYMLFYYLIPGVSHIANGYFPFFEMQYSPSLIQSGSMIIPIFVVTFAFGYAMKVRTPRNYGIVIDAKLKFVCLCTAALAMVLGVSVGLSYFQISRGEQELYSDILHGPLITLMITATRAMAFIALLCSLLILSRKVSVPNLIILAITIAVVGIIMNPLAIPRSYLASYFLSTLFVFRPLTRKLKFAILSVLIVGQVTVLPLLSELQRGSGQFDFWSAVNEVSESADFDGLQSTINVVAYADTAGFKYGDNLLSAALVFVPRSVWPSKSYAAGAEAAEAMGYAYINVSSPLPSEFYLDFGYFGVVIGGFLVGWIFRYIDVTVAFRRMQKNRLLIISSACFISFIFIVLRGSLIGTFGALFLTVIVGYLVTGFAGKIISFPPVGRSQ